MLDWKQINGVWYCYKNGTMVKGWVQDTEKRWYYLNATDGKMATGWIEIDSKWYYLYTQQTEKDSNTHYTGEMATGWIQIDSKWYYLLTQKTEYNGNTHYTGEMVASTTMTINNKSYTFDENGVMQEGGNGLYSEKLIEFIKGWEVFYPHAYPDPYSSAQAHWTIGYGTTYSKKTSAFPNGLSSTCTIEQADQWVREEATAVANQIKSALDSQGATIPQYAFDCLCDIGYNAGTADLIGGNTWSAIISGNASNIETWIMKWCGASGTSSSPGLVKRCRARVNMCLYGTYDSTH